MRVYGIGPTRGCEAASFLMPSRCIARYPTRSLLYVHECSAQPDLLTARD